MRTQQDELDNAHGWELSCSREPYRAEGQYRTAQRFNAGLHEQRESRRVAAMHSAEHSRENLVLVFFNHSDFVTVR
jgi:hypothetical protein